MREHRHLRRATNLWLDIPVHNVAAAQEVQRRCELREEGAHHRIVQAAVFWVWVVRALRSRKWIRRSVTMPRCHVSTMFDVR